MKIRILLIMVLFASVFTGCEDVLDKEPLDVFSEDDIWNDKVLAEGFVYETYNSAWKLYFRQWNGGIWKSDYWTDNFGDYGADAVADELFDAFTDPEGMFKNNFQIIRKCNLIIENVTASEGIYEDEKFQLIGEGYFLRAYVNYMSAKLFGRFVIVDKVLTPEDELKLPLGSIQACYDFILSDLDKAAQNLDETSSKGRANKYAAYALKSEVALQAAAYVGQNKDQYYNAAKTAAENVIGGPYSLDSDYDKLFNNYDYAFGSSEIILADFESEDNTQYNMTPMQWIIPNTSAQKQRPGTTPTLNESFEGWIGIYPSQDLVEKYLVVDEDGIAKRWNETSYYQNYLTNGGYVSDFMYKNRDKRFYASIAYDSTMYFNNLITTRVNGNASEKTIYGTWGITHSTYFLIKGVYQDKKSWHSDATPYCFPHFRLGRAYMNYAEALLRLGDTPDAIGAINETRTIHGQLPALETSLSEEEAWTAYKEERQVELVSEDDRYWSLLRWGKEEGGDIIEELNRPLRGLIISEDGKTVEEYELPFDKDRRFTTKRYLFPIPEGERQANENLGEQNPGW